MCFVHWLFPVVCYVWKPTLVVNSPWLIFLMVNTIHSHPEEVDDRDHFTPAQFVTDNVKNFTLQPNGS